MKKVIAALLVLTLLAGCGEAAVSGAGSSSAILMGGGSISRNSSSHPIPESPPAQGESQPTPESPASESASASATSGSSQATLPPASSTKPPAAESTPKKGSGQPEFVLSSDTVKAGDYLTLTCKNPPELTAITTENTLPGIAHFYLNGDEAVAFVGVSRNSVLGNQSFTAYVDGQKVAALPYTVVDAKFQQEAFQMDESVQSGTVGNSAAQEEYNRITASVMAVETAEPKFPPLDHFVMPVAPQNLRISSSYGFTRVVNGKVSGRHEGVDFPAPRGTPVVAAGNGKVLYAGLMKMTGNTVIIEHGMGVKTWYHHMDSLDCKTGDVLQAGDPVGKVGTTGYSTGNHLHFGVSIFDIYTDPFQFITMP